MSDTKFPTPEQIERRADQIIDGLGYPFLPQFPGLVFRRLTLAERGQASLAYSRHLKDSMAQGGRFSEALLPTELRRRCLEVGVNYDDLMAQEEAFQRRIFDMAPAELGSLRPRLTDDEVAELAPEARKEYLEALQQASKMLHEFINSLFTDEEKIVRAQIEQVKSLRAQLLAETYEHHARIHQRLVEVICGARRADGEPYFESIDALYDLQDTDNATLLALCAKWREFKEGRWPGFTPRSSSTPTPGA